MHSSESSSRTNVAVSAGSRFTLSIASHQRDGHERETWRCWLRVVVSQTINDEDGPVTIRDAWLPVDVSHFRYIHSE